MKLNKLQRSFFSFKYRCCSLIYLSHCVGITYCHRSLLPPLPILGSLTRCTTLETVDKAQVLSVCLIGVHLYSDLITCFADVFTGDWGSRFELR